MKVDLKILILEDDDQDADLLNRELEKSGLNYKSLIVETKAAFEDALLTFNPDLILSDYSLPSFNAITAFSIKQTKLPHIPFIIVSGVIGEENAVDLIKKGVTDYVSKDKLFSLIPKINRAIKDSEDWKEKQITAEKLKIQAAALLVANKELAFQKEEKEKRSTELIIANKELVYQKERLNLVHKLEVYQIELELQNEELKLARERAETIAQKYTSLYDFAPIGYFILSKEGKILDLNLAGAKILGKDRSSLKKKLFDRFIPEKGHSTFNLYLEKAFQSKTNEMFEMFIMGSGDSPMFAQLTAIVEDEHPDQLLITVMDITARKKAELEIEEAANRMNVLNSQKDMFFSIIAHDLRNPFNAIIGYTELLLMEIRSKNYHSVEEFAEIVLNSSKRAMDLLTNLMEWARSQTGRLIYNPMHIGLLDVVNEVTDMIDQIGRQKDVTIRKDISNDIEILADKDMIATVIRNLVSNAVKFTKPGGEIIIYTEQTPTSITLCVKDNGIGIAKDNLEKLFRIDAGYTSKGTKNEKGTGLGLILCKEFVEKHGGEIWAETEKDLGSTFFVSLPR